MSLRNSRLMRPPETALEHQNINNNNSSNSSQKNNSHKQQNSTKTASSAPHHGSTAMDHFPASLGVSKLIASALVESSRNLAETLDPTLTCPHTVPTKPVQLPVEEYVEVVEQQDASSSLPASEQHRDDSSVPTTSRSSSSSSSSRASSPTTTTAAPAHQKKPLTIITQPTTATTTTANADAVATNDNKKKKQFLFQQVRFDTIQFYHHPITVGVNPGGKLGGPPLTIDWDCDYQETVSVNDHQQLVSQKPRRRANTGLRLSAEERQQRLLAAGCGAADIATATEYAQAIRLCRYRSLNERTPQEVQEFARRKQAAKTARQKRLIQLRQERLERQKQKAKAEKQAKRKNRSLWGLVRR